MIERDLTDVDGVIIIRSSGRWSRSELDAHFAALREIIARKRRNGETIRVLSDITGAAEQDEGIVSYILEQFRRTYSPEDRVAILTANADTKHIVRAMVQDIGLAAFSSRLPAEIWLMTDGLPPPR